MLIQPNKPRLRIYTAVIACMAWIPFVIERSFVTFVFGLFVWGMLYLVIWMALLLWWPQVEVAEDGVRYQGEFYAYEDLARLGRMDQPMTPFLIFNKADSFLLKKGYLLIPKKRYTANAANMPETFRAVVWLGAVRPKTAAK